MAAELAAQTFFKIGSIPLTNTFLHTLLVDSIISAMLFSLKKHFSLIPGFLQNIWEFIIESMYDLTESISSHHAKAIFPWFMSFFIFILMTNITALFPGFGSIVVKTPDGSVPLFRSAASDLNYTLGLALLSAVATHFLAIRTVGIAEYLSRYFSLNPLFLFVGVLELVGEVTKVISLSFRLFGNIFAGEMMMASINKVFAFIAPLPLIAFEIAVGIIQALVFAILTMVFMSILMTPHHEEETGHGVE